MERVRIECLRCGCSREIDVGLLHTMDAGTCLRCDYVGWAFADDLTEDDRHELREYPVELRRFEPAGLVSFR